MLVLKSSTTPFKLTGRRPSSGYALLRVLACVLLIGQSLAADYNWKTATSGNWGDANNWNPSTGVPGDGDSATISTSGTYTVTITSTRTVQSLNIGAGTSQVKLLVQQGAQLNVTDQLNYVAPRLDVFGGLSVKTFTWSGNYINGSQASPGVVVVTDYMSIRAGSYLSKYLIDITVMSLRNLTLDPTSMDSGSTNLYCQRCVVVNSHNASLRTGLTRWNSYGAQQAADPADGFRQGLVNHGTFVVEITAAYGVYNSWDLRNHGRVVIVTMNWQSRYNYYIESGRWTNTGAVEIYATLVSFRYTARLTGNGTVATYGTPARSSAPRSNRKRLQWRNYLRELADNTSYTINGQTVYQPSFGSILEVYTANNQIVMEATSLKTYGGAYIQFYYTKNCWLKFDSIEMDANSKIFVGSSNSNNTIHLSSQTRSTIGFLFASEGMNIKAGAGARILFLRSVVLAEGSEVSVGDNSAMTFDESVELTETGSLVTGASSTIVFNRDLQHNGTMDVSRSVVTVLGELQWQDGSINGDNSTLVLSTDSAVTGDRHKTLRGVAVTLIPRKPVSAGSYLAEYFQYRVKTDLQQPISPIYYFPTDNSGSYYRLPDRYDNASTAATLTQVETNFQRRPQYLGYGPLVFRASSPSGQLDSTAPLSFTYDYATRNWFYLQIDTSGMYTFYISQGYGIKLRLFVGGTRVLSAGYNTPFPPTERASSGVLLSVGLHVVHMDYIVRSSYWTSYGLMILLSYTGPGVPKQLIPDGKMFSFIGGPSGERIFANNATSYLRNNSARLDLSGTGLLVALNGSSLALNSNGVLGILSDTILLSYGTTRDIFQITNGGEIIREGSPGTATLFANYKRLPGGKLTVKSGLLEFRDLNRDGGLATWNNPNGGNWMDGKNWIPARVPMKNDIVFITLPGSYAVIVPGDYNNVTVDSLIIGGYGSNPLLQVSFFTHINVLDKLDIRSQHMTINGYLTARNVDWSGGKIVGGGFSSKLTATGTFSIIWSSYPNKFLDNIIVESQGNGTVDSSVIGGTGTTNAVVYCTNCRLINAATGAFVTTSMFLYSGSSGACASPGSLVCSSPGFVNYGTLVVELTTASAYWQVSVWNHGRVIVAEKTFPSAYTWQHTGAFNGLGGTLDVYMAVFKLYTTPDSHLGAVRVYGWPVKTTSLAKAPGANKHGQWREYLDDIFNGSLGYDLTYQTGTVLLQSLYGSSATHRRISMTSYEGYGRVRLYTRYCQYILFNITDYVRADADGDFNLQESPYSKLTIGTRQQSSLAGLTLDKGWSVRFADNANITLHRATLLSSNTSLWLGENATTNFNGQYGGQVGSVLQIGSGNVTFSDTLRSQEALNFGKASVTTLGKWILNSGNVSGNIAQITVNGGLRISGSGEKVLRNVHLTLQTPPQLSASTENGVIVEFFQFRVKNGLYPVSSYWFRGFGGSSTCSYGCTPVSFNSDNATANYVDIRKSVNHGPQRFGFGPLDYLSNRNSINTSSPLTFTHTYGSRWWFFVNVPAIGYFRFHIRNGYSLMARLWVDGVVKVISGFDRNYYTSPETTTPPLPLAAGLHRIRLDLLATNSGWDANGNGLQLSWSRPNSAKVPIADSQIFYRYGGAWAQPTYDSQPAAITSPYNTEFSGLGPVLAQETVRVDIAENSVFDVQSDATWQCFNPTVCSFLNYGVLRRSKLGGLALIYALYREVLSGKTDIQVSGLKIQAQSNTSNVVSWTSPSGGVWSNASNWGSERVPAAGDTVYINLPGTYTIVMLSGDYNLTHLILGSSTSFPTLVVDHYASLFVMERLDVRSSTLNIKGRIQTQDMIWSGEYIKGSTATFASNELIITGSFVMQQGGYTKKYLQNINIKNFGKLSEDSAISSAYQQYLYMNDSTLTNHFNATTELATSLLYEIGSSTKVKYNFINYGIAILYSPSASTKTIAWRIRNFGDFYIFPRSPSSSYTVNLNDEFLNNGKVAIYNVKLSVQSNGNIAGSNGSWHVYGAAYLETYTDFQPATWRQFIRNPYNDTTVYTSFGILQAYSQSDRVWRMGTLELQGAYISLYYCYNTSIDVSGKLLMGEMSRIDTIRCQRTPCGLTVSGNVSSQHSVGLIGLDYGWNMTITGSSAWFMSGVNLKGGSKLNVETQTAEFNGPVRMAAASSMAVQSAAVTFARDVQLAGGTMLLGNSTSASFQAHVAFTSGSIAGAKLLEFQKELTLSTSGSKVFDSVAISLNPKLIPSTQNGIVADYFQYRVATAITPRVGTIYYFYNESSSSWYRVPAAFDDPNSEPNVRRFEKSLQRPPTYNGRAPLSLSPTASHYDLSNSGSFTYTYAMRLWTYLSVPKLAFYTFYYRRGYSTKVRLWVDGAIVPGSSAGFDRSWYSGLQKAGTVIAHPGLVHLRLDCIVKNAQWQTRGNGLELYWDYNGTVHRIPDSNFFPVSQSQTAAPGLRLTLRNACSAAGVDSKKYPFSFARLLTSGTGAVHFRGDSSLNVGARGILELQSSTPWQYSAGQPRLNLTIAGMVARPVGAGEMRLNAQYSTSATSCINVTSGTLLLGLNGSVTAAPIGGTGSAVTAAPTTGASTALPTTPPPGTTVQWKTGGSPDWSDPNNWSPRLPAANDNVFISQSGAFLINLLTSVTVSNLTIGTASSTSSTLQILSKGQLRVLNTLTIHSTTTVVEGSLDANTILWSGTTITALPSNKASVSQVGRINVRHSMYVSVSTHKTLRSVVLINRGKLTFASSLYYYSTTCRECQILNAVNATILTNTMSWYAAGNVDASKPHLVNRGTFVSAHSSSRGMTISISVQNYNEMIFVYQTTSQTARSVTFSSANLRLGMIRSYFCHLAILSNPSYVADFTNASVEVFAYPRFPTSSFPATVTLQSEWKTYIKDAFSTALPGQWSRSLQVLVALKGLSSFAGTLPSFRLNGNVQLSMTNCKHVSAGVAVVGVGHASLQLSGNVDVAVALEQSAISELSVAAGSSANLSSGSVVYNRILLKDQGSVYIYESAAPPATPATPAPPAKQLIVPSVTIGAGAWLNITLPSLVIYNLDLYGTLNCTLASNVTVRNVLRWQGGSLVGRGSNLIAEGPCNVTGEQPKTLQNATLTIGNRPTTLSASRPVLVQLFQYRVKTSTSTFSTTGNLYYFPGYGGRYALPQSFDNLTTVPTVQYEAASLSRSPFNVGLEPMMYTPDGSSVDYNSPWSFTDRYAIRKLSHLKITTAGTYTFAIEFYFGSMRLWLDGGIIINPQSAPTYIKRYTSPSMHLNASMHLIRVDFIQSTTRVTSDNAFTVYYSGPGISLQPIPDNILAIDPASTPIQNLAAAVPNVTRISGEGVLFSRVGADVIVESRRQLEFVGDVQWLSVLSAQQSTLTNYGTLLKTGGGLASLTLHLSNQSAGVITTELGKFQFQTPTANTSAYFWQNPAGGSWTDADNWLPRGVPGESSSVFIMLEGIYHILVPTGGPVQVANVLIGRAASQAELNVGLFAKLIVSDHLEVHSSRFVIDGEVQASRFTWSGTYLVGKTSVQQGGVLTVTNTFLLTQPLSGAASTSKYLQGLHIVSMGLCQLPYQLLRNLYCSSCEVSNYGSMVMQSISLYAQSGSATLRNYGNMTMEIGPGSRTAHSYWSVINAGNVTIVTDQFLTSNYWWNARLYYIHGTWANNGTTNVYMVQVTMDGNAASAKYPASTGTFRVWGVPLLNRSHPWPASYRKVGGSAAFLATAYNGSVSWDPFITVTWTLQGFFNRDDVYIGRMETFGRANVVIKNSPGVAFHVTGGIAMPALSLLTLAAGATGATFMVSPSASQVSFGSVQMHAGWTLNCRLGTDADFAGRVVIGGNSTLTVSSRNNTIVFVGDLYVNSNSSFASRNSTITTSRLTVQGLIQLHATQLLVQRSLLWSAGSMVGDATSSSVTVAQQARVFDSHLKCLDGLNLILTYSPVFGSSSLGVVAEYYQYRLPNAVISTIISSPTLCAPCTSSCSSSCINPSFDDTAVTANVVRLEKDISKPSSLLSHGPLDFLPGGTSVNASSAGSYTYQYAVRWSAYLKIDTAGYYNFFSVAYNAYTRLWVSDKYVGRTGSTSSTNVDQMIAAVPLLPGHVHIRFEVLLASSSVYAHGYLFRYEGPGVPRQNVPATKLSYRIPATASTWTYASSSYAPTGVSTVVMAQNSLNLIDNRSTISVAPSGVLDIQQDMYWSSRTFDTAPSNVVNAGLIKKTAGVGEAIFLATLVDKGGSLAGNVQFGKSANGSVAYWSNPRGGWWHDAANWLPARLPLSSDYVFITLAGTYSVVISPAEHVTVRSLEVGGPGCAATLLVDHFATVNVTSTWIQNSAELRVYGSVYANDIVWTGASSRMLGPATHNQRGSVTFNTMAVEPGASAASAQSRYRYIFNITLTCNGALTWNESVQYGYCDRCNIVVTSNATMTLAGRHWYVYSIPALTPGAFKQGITNYGTIGIVGQYSYYYTVAFHNDILNFGTINIASRFTLAATMRIIFDYGTVLNYGTINTYNIYAQFSSVTVPFVTTGSRWNFWGFPLGIPSSGITSLAKWQEQIHHYYSWTQNNNVTGLPRLWDMSAQVTVVFGSSTRAHHFKHVQVAGCHLDMHAGNVTIHNTLTMDKATQLTLRSGRNGLLTLEANSNATVASLLALSGWTVNIKPGSAVHVLRQHYIAATSSVSLQSASLRLGDTSTISGRLILQDSELTAAGAVNLAGTLTLKRSIATLSGGMAWRSGTVNGTQNSVLFLQRGGTISPAAAATPLKLSGVQVRVQATVAPVTGVIAEYFQYRIATASPPGENSTPQISYLRYFPSTTGSTSSGYLPASFDNPNSRPTLTQMEDQLGWPPQYNGHAPIQYSATGYVDTYSAKTFTYNYAVRYWTFLSAPTSGIYTFYFSSVVSKPFRIWVDDVIVVAKTNTAIWPQNITSKLIFKAGMNKLRLDLIQTSSAWQTYGNMFMISYEGPGTPLQTLHSNMYTRAYYGGTIQYANTGLKTFSTEGEGVCNSTASVAQLCFYDFGVSCLQQVKSGTISFEKSPFIYIAPNGILNFAVDTTPLASGGGGQLTLLVAGIVSKTGGTRNVSLQAAYNSTGCQRTASATGAIDLGNLTHVLLPSIATPLFPTPPAPPTTRPTVPPTTTGPAPPTTPAPRTPSTVPTTTPHAPTSQPPTTLPATSTNPSTAPTSRPTSQAKPSTTLPATSTNPSTAPTSRPTSQAKPSTNAATTPAPASTRPATTTGTTPPPSTQTPVTSAAASTSSSTSLASMAPSTEPVTTTSPTTSPTTAQTTHRQQVTTAAAPSPARTASTTSALETSQSSAAATRMTSNPVAQETTADTSRQSTGIAETTEKRPTEVASTTLPFSEKIISLWTRQDVQEFIILLNDGKYLQYADKFRAYTGERLQTESFGQLLLIVNGDEAAAAAIYAAIRSAVRSEQEKETSGQADSSFLSSHVHLIVGIAGGVALVLIILVVIIVIMCRMQRKWMKMLPRLQAVEPATVTFPNPAYMNSPSEVVSKAVNDSEGDAQSIYENITGL